MLIYISCWSSIVRNGGHNIFADNSQMNSMNIHFYNFTAVVANALGGIIVVIEFKLKSRNWVHFQTNNVGKSMNKFIP